MTGLGCVAIAAILTSAVVARAEPAAIMVLAADATPVDAAITDAVVRGAQRVSPSVTAGSASLADTAFIAGCDPAVPACLDAVSSQLGVGQLVIVAPRKHGGQVIVEVAASRPGGAPKRRSFAIGADPKPSLAEIEDAIPTLLGAAPTRAAVAAPIAAAGTVADAPRPRPRGALILTIGGGVLAGAGLALWAVASSTQRDIDDAPTTTPSDLERLAALERDGRTYAGVGNGLVIAGAVAAAAGLGWLLWDRRRDRALRITPVATAQRAGLALEGSW